MPVVEAPPQDLRQSRYEVHFQPEAGNEVLKDYNRIKQFWRIANRHEKLAVNYTDMFAIA